MIKGSNFAIIVASLILLNIIMSISVSHLTTQNITGAEILFIRAVFNLLLALGIGIVTKQKMLPTQPGLQSGSFICIGLSLLLIFTAYQYISAGSVSTLQRLDIPLLVLIAVFTKGQFSRKRFGLAVLSFAFVILMVLLNRQTGEKLMGYLLLLAAVGMIAINTLLQKKIAVKENIVTIMIVVCLSSIFWGGFRCWQVGSTFQHINPAILLFIFGLAVINVIVFYLVNALYKTHSPEFVRYPYLIAAFGTMIAEMLLTQKWQSPIVIAGNVFILILMSILIQPKSAKVFG